MVAPSIPRLLGPAGRFVVQRVLGSGGFADVLLARDRQRQSPIAIKLLKPSARASVDRERLRREFDALARLDHPNLARHYQLFEESGACYFTMELVDGPDWLSYHRPDLGSPHPERARFVPCTPEAIERLRKALPQLIAGVAYAHDAGLLHGDLKPDNVRVTYAGRVVVLDYGLGAGLGSEGEAVVGAPAYMAPEQWERSAHSPAMDWYAVGAMLFEVLTGVLPFAGAGEQVLLLKRTVNAPRPSSVVSHVPADVDQLCVDLLQSHPKKRPTSAELVARLPIAHR